MVICKFYLAGRCQFGNNCRYDHIDLYEDNSQYASPRSNFSRPGSASSNRPSFTSPLLSSNAPTAAPNRRGSETTTDPSRFRWVSPTRTVTVAPTTSSDRHGSATTTDPSRFRWVPPTLTSASASVQQQRRSSNTTSVLKEEEPAARPARVERERSSSGPITDEQSLLKRIQADMAEWRESAQWPFSCYGLKGYPSMLGFIDCSPEELRLRAYDKRAANKMSDYEREMKILMDGIRIQWTRLLTLSPADTQQMLLTLRPYIANVKSEATLAKKSSDASGSKNSQPTFSFKIPEPVPSSSKPSSTSTAENRAPSASNAQDPSKFSFKMPSTGAAALKPSNENVKQDVVNPVYTEKRLLTPDELRAFEASEFLSFSDIPFRPPPKELC